jgi:hypothetical protein
MQAESPQICFMTKIPVSSSLLYSLDQIYHPFLTSIVSFFLLIDGDEAIDAPFQIHRNLLRRRHVRKEQIQRRRRQQEKAKHLAERNERDRRKRCRVEETKERKEQSTVGTAESSTLELSTPKRSNAVSPRLTVSIHHRGIPFSLVASPHCDSPTFLRVPTVSPRRPKKRRNARFE